MGYKLGMTVNVRHIKKKHLPDYVFPNGRPTSTKVKAPKLEEASAKGPAEQNKENYVVEIDAMNQNGSAATAEPEQKVHAQGEAAEPLNVAESLDAQKRPRDEVDNEGTVDLENERKNRQSVSAQQSGVGDSQTVGAG